MTVVSVYATFSDAEEAARIGRVVVEERLAACINIFPEIRSIYRWNDAVEESREAAAVFKTSAARADALVERIAGLHSYDVPCITVAPVTKLLSDYGDWVEQATAGPLPLA